MSRLITEGPKAGRMPCCIIGCGRTFKDEGHTETMCGKHWRLADKRLRRLVSAIEKRAKRVGWSDRLLQMHHRQWIRAKHQAQDRSMGL